jgi:hypothetical protein
MTGFKSLLFRPYKMCLRLGGWIRWDDMKRKIWRKKWMAATKILMNSMTYVKRKIWRGKIYRCKEDSDEFNDSIWKGRYGGEKWVAVRIKTQEKLPGVKIALKTNEDSKIPCVLWFLTHQGHPPHHWHDCRWVKCGLRVQKISWNQHIT